VIVLFLLFTSIKIYFYPFDALRVFFFIPFPFLRFFIYSFDAEGGFFFDPFYPFLNF